MSIQDSSIPAQGSSSSVSVGQATVARQRYRSRRRWFVADDLRLCLRCTSNDGKFETVDETNDKADKQIALFQDAIALAEHEPLLTCIDHWCAAALDWRPLPAAEQVPLSPACVVEGLTGTDVDVMLSALNWPERTVELALTAQRLASMPAFPAELTDMAALSWRQISLALCIDRFVLSNDDIERLGPGALIVLPASFNEVWLGDVREVSGGAEVSELEQEVSEDKVAMLEEVDSGEESADFTESTQNNEVTGVRIDATTGELLRLLDKQQVDDWQSAFSSADASISQSPTLNVMLADPVIVDVRRWRAASADLPMLTACGSLCGKRVRLQIATGASVVDKYIGEIVSLGQGYAVRLSTTMDCS